MRKLKVDDYDLKVVINALYQTRTEFPAEERYAVDDVLLMVVNMCERMKPGRKRKMVFESSAINIIRRCLVNWRNLKIEFDESVAVEVINETLLLFSK